MYSLFLYHFYFIFICTHVAMLILLLIDVQYLQDDGFSFDKGLICQSNSSLNSHNPINPPPSKNSFSPSLSSIWKTLVHFRVLLFLLFVGSCLLYQHTMSKKLGKNLNKIFWLLCWQKAIRKLKVRLKK